MSVDVAFLGMMRVEWRVRDCRPGYAGQLLSLEWRKLIFNQVVVEWNLHRILSRCPNELCLRERVINTLFVYAHSGLVKFHNEAGHARTQAFLH